MQKCTNCGSTDLEEDRSRGEVACRDCGTVLEENMIVNEVQFQESGGGSSTVIGTFVAADDGGRQMPGFSTSALGFKRESRQVTLAKAKRRLEEVGSLLRMNRRQTDMAYSFYQSALNRGWTRGRQVKLVTAACLYIVCRLEGTSHMLLDLSDVLEVNVYTLGKTYMEIAKRLNIQIPALDPCLYIQRFASKMEFGAQTTKVESTAMRLMQRMKKDWISTGRRPSGLAAAALLVAARLHDFNRNYEDVARIARISQQTARKRLAEFGKTASSSLTIEEFLQVDYEEEHDPPAFYEALKRSKVEVEDKDMEALEEEIEELEKRIDQELEHLRQRRNRMYGQSATPHVSTTSEPTAEPDNDAKLSCLMQSTSDVNLTESFILRDSLEGVVSENLLEDCVQDLQRLTGAKEELLRQQKEAAEEREMKNRVLPVCDTEGMVRLVFKETKEEKVSEIVDTPKEPDDGTLDLTGIDDDELEKEYILTKREVIIKAREWYRENADYVQYMKMKAEEERLKQEKEEAEGGPKEEKKRKKKYTARKKAGNRQHGSAQEAIEAIVKEKKLSTKIDYDALRSRQVERIEIDPPDPPASPPPAKVARVKAELPSLPTSLRVSQSPAPSRPESPVSIQPSNCKSAEPERLSPNVSIRPTKTESSEAIHTIAKVESSSPLRQPVDQEELRLVVDAVRKSPQLIEDDDDEPEEDEEEENGENDLINMLRKGRAQMGGFDDGQAEDMYGGYDDGDCDYYDDY